VNETRRTGTMVAAATLAAGAVLMAASTGLIGSSWESTTALVLICAGAVLVALGRRTRALYVGALARDTSRPARLWALRGATVATAPIAGLGPVLYALLALSQSLAEPDARPLPVDWQRALGIGLFGAGFVLVAGELGLQVGSDALVWPVLLAASGLSAFWWLPWPSPRTQQLIAAAVLVLALFWGAFAVQEIDSLILAAIAGAGAITLVVAPRWLRSSRALASERAARARSEERAEVAEVVHDSVLQTLALIQSRADDPAEVRALARGQERDLRSVLFNGTTPATGSVAAALRAVAAEIEEAHRVTIGVVTVGDAPLDTASGALVAAAREALVNAVRHADGTPVSLYAEIDEDGVTAYVRDRGPGFDLATVPEDRRGVRDSIVARMERHGGVASLRTAPGGGCEVRLKVGRAR
jgi:signal transduction histidine kinase